MSPLSYPVIARLARHVHCLYLYTQHSISPSVKLHMLLLRSQCYCLIHAGAPCLFGFSSLCGAHCYLLTWTIWRYLELLWIEQLEDHGFGYELLLQWSVLGSGLHH